MKYQSLITILFLFSLSNAVTITSGIDEGQDCFIVTTVMATYYYQKSAGAFSSIKDGTGIDWIDYNTSNGTDPSGTLRGLPGLSYDDSLGHPGFTRCTSVQAGDTTIVTTSNDGLWEWQWDFAECQALMTMTRVPAGGTYSFSYNGPPAGTYGESNYWGADSIGYPVSGRKDTTGFFGWACFGDTAIKRIFFIAQNETDTILDNCSWLDGADSSGMVSFSFGSDGSAALMNTVNAVFTMGFLEQKVHDSTTYAQAADAIKLILYQEQYYPLHGISVTTHWSGEGQAIQGGWGNIIRHDIENDSVIQHTTLYTGHAFYPKINMEGTRVAFNISNENMQGAVIGVMDINGNNLKIMEDTRWFEGTAGFIDWPYGRWIYYLPNWGPANEIYRVHADSGTVEKVMTIKLADGQPTYPWIWTMSADGSRMVFRASDYLIYHLQVPQVFPAEVTLIPDGGDYNGPTEIYGCQHSLSPSGNYMCYGPPADAHRTIRIKQWNDGSNSGCLKKFTQLQLQSWLPSQSDFGSEYFHNHWSNNSDWWICGHEGSNKGTYEIGNQVLYNWVEHRQLVVTTNTGETPDFDGAGDFQIDTSNRAGLPVIHLSKTFLAFEADSGFANPESQDVQVTNISGGTLAPALTAVHYTAGDTTGWLNPYLSAGSGNAQTITNAVDITGLTGGNYRAVVTVSVPNAACAKIYSVLLTVDATRVFSRVAVYPDEIIMEPGDTCLFTAVALDQYDNPLATQPARWTWNADSNSFIQNGIFTSAFTKSTPYIITATGTVGDITLTDTALALVERPILKILSPNGGESYHITDTVYIQWECGDTTIISTVALELSVDNGRTWHALDSSAISPLDPQWGNYQWIIPYTLDIDGSGIVPISNDCKIRVRDYQFPTYRDVSDMEFSIGDAPTGLKQARLNKRIFGIFQNSTSSFRIQIPQNTTSYAIDIVSINGRTILSQCGSGAYCLTVNRRMLAAGIYLVRARADKKVLTKRLLLY